MKIVLPPGYLHFDTRSVHTDRFFFHGYALYCDLCTNIWAKIITPYDCELYGGLNLHNIRCEKHGEGWIIPDHYFKLKEFDLTDAFMPMDLTLDFVMRVKS